MIKMLYSIVAHRLTRTAVLLQFGSTGAMVIQAVANIILARMFGAEHFGIYAIAFSVASVGSIVLGAGAVDALAPSATKAWHSGERGELRGIVTYLVKFAAAAGLVALVVVLILPAITNRIYGDAAVGLYAGMILMASLVSSLGISILTLGLQLTGRYGQLSGLTLTDMTVRFIFSVILVWLGLGVGGAVTGQLVGAVLVFGLVAWTWHRLNRTDPLWPSVREVFSRIRETSLRTRLAPTLWVLGDRNIAMLFGALPIAIGGAYLAATDVSYAKVALGYVTLALSVIGPISVLLNVEFPKRLLYDAGSARRMFVRVSLATMALTTGIMLVISLIARWVIVLLYGSGFAPSVPVVYSFFVFGATLGLGAGLGPMWRALHRVRISLLINSATLALGVPIGVVLVRTYGPYGIGFMMTLWYGASQLASFFYLLRELKRVSSR